MLLLILLKIKFLVLIIQPKQLTITQILLKLKKKNSDHDHSNEYINTPEFNKLTSENFAARLKQANLASRNDIENFVKSLIKRCYIK